MIVNKLILSVNELDVLEEVIGDSIINNEHVKYYLGIDKEDLTKYRMFFNKVWEIFDKEDIEDIEAVEVELSLDVNEEFKTIICNYINRNTDRICNEDMKILLNIIEKLDYIRNVEIRNVMSYRV